MTATYPRRFSDILDALPTPLTLEYRPHGEVVALTNEAIAAMIGNTLEMLGKSYLITDARQVDGALELTLEAM